MDEAIPVLDAFFSEYLGCDIRDIVPGHTCITATPRREQRELHHPDSFALWMLIAQSRCAISVHGPLLRTVSKIAHGLGIEGFRHPLAVKRFVVAVTRGLGLREGISSTSGPVLYCTNTTLRPARLHPCRPVTPADLPAVRATGLYDSSLEQSVTDGTCFAAFDDGRPVSLAGTLAVPHMADSVADMHIPGTIATHRRRGFGRTAVSHATGAVIDRNRVPVYLTSDRNAASVETAHSVGYREYGWQFRVRLPD